MITTMHITNYPLSAINKEIVVVLEQGIFEHKSISRKWRRNVGLMNAYLDISMRRLELDNISCLKSAEQLLYKFEDFLNIETNYGQKESSRIHSEVLKMLALCFGFEHNSQAAVQAKAKQRRADPASSYALAFKIQERKKYYQGWFIPSMSGEKLFINLSQFYTQYGESLTDYYTKRMVQKLSKYRPASVKNYLFHLKLVNKVMCINYKNQQDLAKLTNPLEVNEFAEKCFTFGLLTTVASNHDPEAYYEFWRRTTKTFKKVLAGCAFVAEPSFKLIAPNFNTSVYKSSTEYNKTFTPIPLTLKDADALDALKQNLENNRDYLIKVCRKTCANELARYRRYINAAKRGRILENVSNASTFEGYSIDDLCATWHHAPYQSNCTIEKAGYESTKDFIYTIRSQSLLPFLYLLTIYHPQITPSWFVAFELYNTKNKMTGFTQAAKGYKVKSRKARANKVQIITLNKKTTKLFKIILKLTAEARSYLKASGSDDWRYLLMGTRHGFATPKRMKIIPSLKYLDDTHAFKANLLNGANNALPDEYTPALINRLTLRTARADQLVIKYLETLSENSVSKEAGHSSNSARLIASYIPPEVRHFIFDRWIRQFQNAVIYDVMKGSPHLLHSMDFNSESDLDWFLKNIRGDYDFTMQSTHTTPTPANNKTNDRVYISLNREKLVVLLSIYEMVTDAIAERTAVTDIAMKWYRVACLVRTAGSLANEGKIGGTCSQAAAYLLKTTQPSFQVAQKLRVVVYGPQA